MEKFKIVTHDDVTLNEEDYREALQPLIGGGHVIQYDAEYGTKLKIKFGTAFLNIIIPPDYREEIINVQLIHLQEKED